MWINTLVHKMGSTAKQIRPGSLHHRPLSPQMDNPLLANCVGLVDIHPSYLPPSLLITGIYSPFIPIVHRRLQRIFVLRVVRLQEQW